MITVQIQKGKFNPQKILENAEKFPVVYNFSAVPEPEKFETHKLFSDCYSLGNDFKYINAGFFITNKNDAFKLGNYMINRIKIKKKGKPKNTCNGIFNEFLYLNDKNFKFNILNKKWNYMPHLDNSEKIKPNLIHFIGDYGSRYLIECSKKNENRFTRRKQTKCCSFHCLHVLGVAKHRRKF